MGLDKWGGMRGLGMGNCLLDEVEVEMDNVVFAFSIVVLMLGLYFFS